MNPTTEGGQARIPGANVVEALFFQVTQEGQRPFGRDGREQRLFRMDTVLLLEEAQEQVKGVAVSGDGPWTQIALLLEIVPEKALNPES